MTNTNKIIVIQNVDTLEYFFSTDHCQPDLDDNFVPCTMGVLKGMDAKKHVKIVYYSDGIEIPNPNPKYQA